MIPRNPTPSYSGTPTSATVGTSGSIGMRVLPVTASARSLPARTCSSAPGMSEASTIDVVAQQPDQRGPEAAERDVRHLDAGLLRELLHGEMGNEPFPAEP